MPSLFDPIRIGTVEIPNRIAFSPMTTNFEEKGEIGARSLAFYRRIAQGGAGLIVLGSCAIQPALSPTPGLYDDRFLPGLKKLVETVHASGAKISAQLLHPEYDAVELAALAKSEGAEAVARRVREDALGFVNRASLEQIRRIQERYVAAARRACEVGFDLVQIQGDYLPGQFFSPVQNRRSDGYGGSFEGRMRFAIETLLKIHQALPGLEIDFRLPITANGQGKYGLPLEEARRVAPWLVKAGASAIHAAPADHTNINEVIPPAGSRPYGCFVDLATALKEVVSVPVTTSGRIVRPELAEAVLQTGRADMVFLGRALLSDPEWPLKTAEGREAEIRECVMCNVCADSLISARPLTCAINAQTGLDVEQEIVPAEHPCRVMVAGGGPAGMEAARVASLRGHQVTLFERTRALGGQLRLAAYVQGQEELKRINTYLAREMARLGVLIRFGTEVTVDTVRREAPDRVIVAAGVLSHLQSPLGDTPAPEVIPGAYGANAVDARDVLAGVVKPGKKVIIVGGGLVGANAALALASQGHQVTLVEKRDRVGQGCPLSYLPLLQERLEVMGVETLTRLTVIEITHEGVLVREASGKQSSLKGETVVLAAGIRTPERGLVEALQAAGIAFLTAGDCAGEKARWLGDAIRDGFKAGLKI